MRNVVSDVRTTPNVNHEDSGVKMKLTGDIFHSLKASAKVLPETSENPIETTNSEVRSRKNKGTFELKSDDESLSQ